MAAQWLVIDLGKKEIDRHPAILSGLDIMLHLKKNELSMRSEYAEEVRMKTYWNQRMSLPERSGRRLSSAIVLVALVLACPYLGFTAEAAQVTIVVIPPNMVFPLLPATVLLLNTPGPDSGTTAVIESGSEGIAGIIRISGHD